MAAPMEVTRSLTKIAFSLSRLRCLSSVSYIPVRCMTTPTVTETSPGRSEIGNAGAAKVEKISQAMKAYLERAKEHDKFMAGEIAEYEIGKRHLANIMGKDPDTFTQEDIDKAIEYLLPSGLFDKKARPKMKHPKEVLPQRKAAQFSIDGRPFDPFFYTGFPKYFNLMHEIATKFEKLKEIDHKHQKSGGDPETVEKILLSGSEWISKLAMEEHLGERLSDVMYERLIKLLERVAHHPFSKQEAEFINSFRKVLKGQMYMLEQPPLLFDEDGRGYIDAEGVRKRAKATVRMWDRGTGKLEINGQSLLYTFPRLMDREQLLFPLLFTHKIGKVDIIATVEDGGEGGKAGALRLALSRALQSFVDRRTVEQMRLAGLLTKDPRRRERKKPGQAGARKKFTWKKR